MRISLLVPLALISTPAAAADQFDLICTSNDGSARYRVDLVAQQWCKDDCSEVRALASVSPTTIQFEDERPAFPGDGMVSSSVNRMTGKWSEDYRSAAIGGSHARVFREGACEPRPFSGFGEEKAKF
jgi:hypothetical protein